MRSLACLLSLIAVACDGAPVDPDAAVTPDAAGRDAHVSLPDSAVEPDAGVAGAPVWVGAGPWGLRSSTRDGDAWETIANPAQADDHTPDLFRAVAVGGGVIVAVGGDRNSRIDRSLDGVRWEEDLHPAGTQWLGGVAYLDGLWVAGGGVGEVVRSTDGARTWERGGRAPSAVRAIAAGDGRFVAVGDGGMIAVSSDGLAWDDRTRAGSLRFSQVAHHAGTWLVAGSEWNGGGFDTECFVSTDTITWTPCPFDGGAIRGVFVTDGRLFVAHASGHEHTRDGARWERGAAQIPAHVFLADGRWVGAEDDRRYAGASLDALAQTRADRGFRAFAWGRLAP
ncbi:MAG: hypothetical protein KF729_04515 [Sandaracinaceae bacterium]|nr:hypothetical protein [Sandaracinaceae bacterium]